MKRSLTFSSVAGAAALCAVRAAWAAPGVEVADLSTMIVSLALVVGFIFAAAFLAKRLPFTLGGRGAGPLKVLAALPLGPKERLVLVQARGEELLIAVSPAGVFNVGAAPTATSVAPTRSAAADAPTFVMKDEP
jgi:flagellar protein FliO/FliZ